MVWYWGQLKRGRKIGGESARKEELGGIILDLRGSHDSRGEKK